MPGRVSFIRNATHVSPRISIREPKFDVPILQVQHYFLHITKRCEEDKQFIQPNFYNMKRNFAERYEPITNMDERDTRLREPNYKRFKVSFDVKCKENYHIARKKYNQQLSNEINKMIQYQSNAVDALLLLRAMSYTTSWPPYHTEAELVSTSRSFFKLHSSESARLFSIMENHIY